MLLKTVSDRFDASRLSMVCREPIYKLFEKGKTVGEPREQYSFIDNSSKVLGVAHCDTVLSFPHFSSVKLPKNNWIIYNTALDDRVGVYTLLYLLPALNINLDILLTENEERCNSTARDFVTEKKYNWIVEFDRAGSGVATYNYDWGQELTRCFGTTHRGSYTDICDLEFLGCKGFNVSTGYEDNHSIESHINVNTYLRQVSLFLEFYFKYKNKHFPHVQKTTLVHYSSHFYHDIDSPPCYCNTCRRVLYDYELDQVHYETGLVDICAYCGNPVDENCYM